MSLLCSLDDMSGAFALSLGGQRSGSNFVCKLDWLALHAEALRAEQAPLKGTRTACFYARRTRVERPRTEDGLSIKQRRRAAALSGL